MSIPATITHEFYFLNGDFEQSIFDSYSGSNDSQLQTNVIEKVNIIKNILSSNTTNFHIFSTFLEYNNGQDDLMFKITVCS